MKIKITSSLLFATLSLALLSSCTGLQLKNQSVCSVAGIMAAGMNCANTIEGDPYEMDLEQTLKFLEPSHEENRAGAMCMSAADFSSMKTTIDLACELLGSSCTIEFRKKIEQISTNLEVLTTSKTAKELVVLKVNAIPKKGDVGKDVVTLQKQLASLGFSPGSVDGVFGNKTAAAVSQFQKSIGLAGSGVIGPLTLKGLSIEVSTDSPVTGAPAITKDLKGRQARFLHPALRLLLEARVFPDGTIPDCFKQRNLTECVRVVSHAMDDLGIREKGSNRGELVGYIQGIIGTYVPDGTGDAWCMSAVQCLVAFLEDFFQVESPVLASEHCVTVHKSAKKVLGLVAPSCEAGTIWNAMHGSGPAGHTGTVLKALDNEKMQTFEGNTGGGSIREGDGAYVKTRNQKKNGTLTTLGFVYIYPGNKLPA